MKPNVEPFVSGQIRLRLLDERDLLTTLDWRNRDSARVWFKTSSPISPEQHQAWFNRYLMKDDDFVFIIEVAGTSVGQASVYGVNQQMKSAEIGRFLAAPEHSGHGYVRQACGALIEFSASNLALDYLFLDVLETNARAISIYESHGFLREWCMEGFIRMGCNLTKRRR